MRLMWKSKIQNIIWAIKVERDEHEIDVEKYSNFQFIKVERDEDEIDVESNFQC
jgi:hypothetical protein